MKSKSCQIESLEARQLLSASAQLADGTLQITGTEKKDSIVVSLNRNNPAMLDVNVNGKTSTFAIADVQKVRIDALGGNDQIEVREKNGAIFANFLIYGGDGNDSITSGSGNDIIDGGNGNDKVIGGAGDDTIYGESGNDNLQGGTDEDTIEAGDGKDTLTGGAGDDNLDGGAGSDSIKAGTGDDSVATDAAHPNEVKGHQDGQVQRYVVTSLADAPAQLVGVAETAVPGAQVVRVEQADADYAIYYRFGTDPEVYKAVVQIQDTGDVDLVSREVSLSEARPSAQQAFGQDTPNEGLVSLYQLPQGQFTVRYRDSSGQIQTQVTNDIDWGLDDAAEDADNDGRYDPHQGDNGNGQQNGDQQNGGQMPQKDGNGDQSNGDQQNVNNGMPNQA